MKTKFTWLFLTTVSILGHGQTWSGSTPGSIYYNQGSVGIGTNPISTLHIKHSSAFFNPGSITLENSSSSSVYGIINSSDNLFFGYNSNSSQNYPQSDFVTRLYISSGGNIGIGATNPLDKLHVNGNISIKPDDATSPSYINFKRASDGWTAARMGQSYNQLNYGGHLVFETNAGSSSMDLVERMRITYNGNVLIGKISQTNTSYRLDVNGSMRSNEVVVNTSGADFVFDDRYNLKDLIEVEKFITDNKHLPDIESAKQMQENGLNLGQMDMKLLQKIEELTLYMIDFKKQIDRLKDENFKLKEEIVELKKN